MKIAHLCTVDSSLRYLLLPQLEGSLARGDETIGMSSPGPDVPFLESKGIRHIPLTASTREASVTSDVRAAWQLARILRQERLDVLHTHNPKPGVYGRILGRMLGVPVVINTVHGLYATETDPLWKRTLVYTLEWLAGLFSDLELVQSAEDMSTMRKLRLARPGKIQHLGNGVDLTRFDGVDGRVRSRLRSELGVGDDAVVVGCVARLVREKGIPELIHAYERRTQDYELVIVGPSDPSKPDALSTGEIASAEDIGVIFLGHRSDVDQLYQAFDMFVLPSHREGFPRAAMEAAATGLPLVVTDVRGCREVVDDGLNGLLVAKGRPDELALAIDRLVSDEALRKSMGEAGVVKARRDFDEQNVVDTVLSAYSRVARAKGIVDG